MLLLGVAVAANAKQGVKARALDKRCPECDDFDDYDDGFFDDDDSYGGIESLTRLLTRLCGRK